MRASIALCGLLASGCMKTSEKYCAMHEDPVHCPAPDAPVGNTCEASTDCAAPTPVCDTAGSKTCVACLTNADCTTQATAPVCSAMHTCGGCRVHTDCPSEACMPDGSCAAMSDVAYVDTVTGSGGGVCARSNPCGKVSQGVASLKSVIKLTGANDEGVRIDDRTATVTLLGGTKAQLLRNNGLILDVQGSTNLVVVDVIIGSDTDTFTTGVSLAAASTGSIELRRVRVQHNSSGGVRVQDGTVRIFDSTIYANLGGGVSVGPTALGYVIRNNFIVGNGKSNGVAPGPSLTGGALLEPEAGGTFEYNTVALNSSSGSRRPGVQCEGPNNAAANNIVVGNSDALNGTNDTNQINTTMACAFGNTYKAGSGVPLMFVSYAGDPPDFHLTAASPATVLDAAGDCAATVPTDFDREARPYNGACDLGADEYHPE
jgi:hypothetical protein